MTPSWKDEKWAKHVPSELAEDLDNIEWDDKKVPTLPEAVEETKYVLGLYSEGSTASSDQLDDEDAGVRKEARHQITLLKAFIKRFEGKA